MSRGAKAGIFVGAVVVLLVVLAVVAQKRKANAATEVRMQQVGHRDLVAVVTSSGQIEAKSQVDISSEVTAKINKIHVKEGDMVKAGELLVELDQAQFKGAVDRAQAGLAQSNASVVQSRATLDQAKRALDRSNELKKLQPTLITTETIEQLQTSLDVAEANLKSSQALYDQAQASLKEATDNLARTMLYSPISGRVVQLPVEEGEVANPGTFSKETGLLMRIADLSVILAKVKVDETDVVRLALNDSVAVSIDAFPDTAFVGRVTKIGNSAAAATTTGTSADKAVDFEVEVTLENPPKDVRPDLSMTARIITAVRKNALSVPIIALTARTKPSIGNDTSKSTPMSGGVPTDTSAAGRAKEEEGVFVVLNGRARFRPVKVGITGDENIEVLDGLKEGETVVAGPYQAVRDMKDSTKVKPATTNVEVKKP